MAVFACQVGHFACESPAVTVSKVPLAFTGSYLGKSRPFKQFKPKVIVVINVLFDQFLLHCTLSLAAQCIVISPVCGYVCVCLWVCYHDNSKLRASILTKLGV